MDRTADISELDYRKASNAFVGLSAAVFTFEHLLKEFPQIASSKAFDRGFLQELKKSAADAEAIKDLVLAETKKRNAGLRMDIDKIAAKISAAVDETELTAWAISALNEFGYRNIRELENVELSTARGEVVLKATLISTDGDERELKIELATTRDHVFVDGKSLKRLF